MINRRKLLLTGFVAPAIVTAANIMPIKVHDRTYRRYVQFYDGRFDLTVWRIDWSNIPLSQPPGVTAFTEARAIEAIGIEKFLAAEKRLSAVPKPNTTWQFGLDFAA